jgi:hypothetical protein
MVVTITLQNFPILSFKNERETANDELNGNIYFNGTLDDWSQMESEESERDKKILSQLTFQFFWGINIVNKDGEKTEQITNPLFVLSGLLLKFLVMRIPNDLTVTNDVVTDALDFNSMTIKDYISINITYEDNRIIITPIDGFDQKLQVSFNNRFRDAPFWEQALRDYCKISNFKDIEPPVVKNSKSSGMGGGGGGRGYHISSRKSSSSSRRRRSTKRRTASRKQQKRRRGSRRAH